MPLPGYQATNIDRNVLIPHGVGFFYKRSGDANFNDVGDVAGVSINIETEFLDHKSNRAGQNATAKRILTDRSMTIAMQLNEVAPENFRYVFLANAGASGSINVQETATPKRTASDTFVLPEAVAGAASAGIVAVTSEDGSSTYVETTDWTLDSDGLTLTIVSSSSLDTDSPNEGDKIHVHYLVAFSGATTQKYEVLANTSEEGVGQFRIRNNAGGLAQILELDSVQLSPNGSVDVPADAIQSLPLLVTTQVLNGLIGRLYIKDI